jgi:hypothetical protein
MAQEFQIVTQRATSASAAMRNRSFTVWPAMALLLCVAQAPIARADPASCIEKYLPRGVGPTALWVDK